MSKFILHFAIFYYFFLYYCNIVTFLNKGDAMSLIIKNAENLFEKFERRLENWAEKLF